jgi:hypothetical protein
VNHARECLYNLQLSEEAEDAQEQEVRRARAERESEQAKDFVRRSSKGARLGIFSANRDGTRGSVSTLGKLVALRFAQYHVPEVVERRCDPGVADEIMQICTPLYHEGYPVAPVGRLSEGQVISVYLGPSLLEALWTYQGEDRAAFERKLWDDLADITDRLVRKIPSIRRPVGRVETPRALIESFYALIEYATCAGALPREGVRGLKQECARECEANYRELERDAYVPFVDPSLRNFLIEGSAAAYLRGEGNVWHGDPDRYSVGSSAGFNLVHLAYQPWEHISLEERIAHVPCRPHADMCYLGRRVGRWLQYGPPYTDALPIAVEDLQYGLECQSLLDLSEQHDVAQQYPALAMVITRAVPLLLQGDYRSLAQSR